MATAVPERIDSLRYVAPFCYLASAKRQEVEQKLTLVEFEANQIAIPRGCGQDEATKKPARLYVVITGSFMVYDSRNLVVIDDALSPGSYFGERAILDTPSDVEIRAITESSAWALDQKDLLSLLAEHNPRFALGLAADLRKKQGIFDHFTSFKAFVFSGLHDPGEGSLNMTELLERYVKLKPALHPLVNDADAVDYEAWSYALRRLPQNITSVYSIVCSRRVLNVLKRAPRLSTMIDSRSSSSALSLQDTTDLEASSHSNHSSEYIISGLSPGIPIKTDARRRTCWEVMPGKVFILLRELVSDYLDVVTCLCIHAIESKKLYNKLKPLGSVVAQLQHGLQLIQSSPDSEQEISKNVISSICERRLDSRDVEGLKLLWPNDNLPRRVLDVLIHHGDYALFLDKTDNSHVVTAEEHWSMRVTHLATDLIGPFENSTESNLVVDIVSSNNHSVLNCLSPYIHSHRTAIWEWGQEHTPELFEEALENDTDRLYPVAKRYFEAFPDEMKRAKEMEREAGICVMLEREFTGISVQLYDLNRLKASGMSFDDAISMDRFQLMEGKRHLLINCDYAFGSQSENILRHLLLSFGQLVRSINILGKAGGLTPHCKRGDILFPTHIVDENENGEIRSVDNSDMSPKMLVRLSGRCVHVGPVVTVLGTVLQSRELLLYYERIWHATGMEMEASWFLRAIDEALNLGILPDTCRTRLLYYVSDTPLKPSSSLASQMTILEGVPPLYSITRLILKRILYADNDAETYMEPNKDTAILAANATVGKSDLRWAKVRNLVRVTYSS